MVQLLLFLTIGAYNPDGVQETGKKIRNWVRSSVCVVCSWQTVMQKNSIEALHQNRNPVVQEAGLSNLILQKFSFQDHLGGDELMH